jgi:hypothetical protein
MGEWDKRYARPSRSWNSRLRQSQSPRQRRSTLLVSGWQNREVCTALGFVLSYISDSESATETMRWETWRK